MEEELLLLWMAGDDAEDVTTKDFEGVDWADEESAARYCNTRWKGVSQREAVYCVFFFYGSTSG